MRNVRQSVPQVQLVTFRVGGEEFGLDVFAVHEILRHTEVTAVPKAPPFVEGVLDVRGALVPVVDLRKRFEVADTSLGDETRIVLVEFQGERLGLIVDSVTEVLRVPETAILPAPKYVKGLAAEFIRGIVRLEGRLIVLVDMDRILSSDERIALLEADMASGGGADEGVQAQVPAGAVADAGSEGGGDGGDGEGGAAAGAPKAKGRTAKG
ncbi:MAG: putative chemotaxis protein CheW [Gemmatimonadetes bacterium]|nr:putative chemotaxis protein CheW [Gemmatimonadota bacterium]